MISTPVLAQLRRRGRIGACADAAHRALAEAHRNRAVLHKGDVIAAESAVRGARLSALIDGRFDAPADAEISAYSLLAPGVVEAQVAALRRAPAGVFAQLDLRAGGPGIPVADAARVQRLAAVVAAERVDAALMPVVLYAEIAGHGVFGPRSGVVARVGARLAAVATGFDPKGIAVPEVYLHRHRQEVDDALAGYARGDIDGALEVLLAAWEAGAQAAQSIISAA
ncbi:hypothetical protein [Corynebacterium uterequi]|uniref:Fido domain-containing protein n=1 Tax=Corynebacterium uterequi TaxID=1072256 RepID=A0A0G3HA16_9CORY|nr:hypothetical protein [Corynebacterium uterequi]AKK10196.1 hypothetical protein CUTER_00875 [Corynebacterium uterequi]